jgi:hypothetical protein
MRSKMELEATAITKPRKSSANHKQRVGQEAAELFGFDGRLTWFGRLRDLVALHLSDLGGEDAASEAEKSIIRRAATLTVELERLDLKFAKAGEASKDDLDLYSRVAANLRRLGERTPQHFFILHSIF